MPVLEIVVFSLITLGTTVTSIIYAFKHIKKCKSICCSCDQEVISNIKETDSDKERSAISPMSANFIKKKATQSAKPIAYMPSQSPSSSPA